jgi:hypothetical protein
MALAVRNYTEAIAAGDWTHNGDPDFVRHLGNARKQKVNVSTTSTARCTRSPRTPDSKRKIDARWPPSQLGSARRRDRRRRQEARPRRRVPLTRRRHGGRLGGQPHTGLLARGPRPPPRRRWLRRLDRHGRLRRLLRGRPPARVRDREVPRGVRHLFARSPTTGASSSSTRRSSGSRSRASASARSPAPTRPPGTSGRPTASTPSPHGPHRGDQARRGLLARRARRPGSDDPPTITAEHPSQCIVACAPGNRRKRLAALKKWVDEDGYVYANVYLPDGVAKFRSREGARRPPDPVAAPRRRPGRRRTTSARCRHPAAQRPSMLRGGRSDLSSRCRSRTRSTSCCPTC